jgi:hypothetical protein
VKKTALLLAAAAALFATSVIAQQTIAPGANVSVVFDQGCRMSPAERRVVLVEYAPGSDRRHIVIRPRPSFMRGCWKGRSQQSQRRARAHL